MQETKFIKQNKKKWEEFEHILSQKEKDPDALSESFIEVTDDLSYSRTFYPNRSVSVYLNNIAQKVFPSLMKRNKLSLTRFLDFWRNDIPSAVWYSRYQFLIAFLLFVISFLIGVFSSVEDSLFPNTILGDGYIEMTKDNIAKGDPMGVYKDHHQGQMFMLIATNNLRVAFFTFIAGILFSMGSLMFLIYNGIMLGAFQYFFFNYDDTVIKDSLLTVWQHGTIEISCIIIAGAAGMVLGKGLLFPSSYTRLQAFQLSARHGVIIFIALIPLIILAALIESFITRYTELPDAVRISTIVLSFLFVLFYFVILPYTKYRSNKLVKFKNARLSESLYIPINLKLIRANGEIFIESFTIIKKFIPKIFRLSILFTVIGIVLFRYFMPGTFYMEFFTFSQFTNPFEQLFWAFPLMRNLFLYQEYIVLFVFNTLTLSLVVFLAQKVLVEFLNNQSGKVQLKISDFQINWIYQFINILILTLIMNVLVINSNILLWIVFLIAFPFYILITFIMIKEGVGIFTALSRLSKLVKGSFSKVFGLYMVFFLLGLGYFLIICSPLLMLLFENIIVSLELSLFNYNLFFSLFISLFMYFGFFAMTMFLIVGMGLQYFSLKEIYDAEGLREQIKKMRGGRDA